jgi:PII-like signaling protein
MPREVSQACAILKIGLWNGADTDWRGTLLYKALLQDAIRAGVRGGTAWGAVEGSKSSRTFRTVESEVTSNELPVLMEFVDTLDVLEPFIHGCQKRLGEKGVMVVELGQAWWHARRGGDNNVNPQERPSSGQTEPLSGAQYDGLQVQIFTLEQNQIDGRPVYQAVAEFLRNRGILWISTARGIAGFGEQRKMRQRRWWMQRSDVPVVMTILDKVDRLEACLPELAEYLGDQGFVVSKPVVWHWPNE